MVNCVYSLHVCDVLMSWFVPVCCVVFTEAEGEANEEVDGEIDTATADRRDPIEFCNHIPSEVRKTTQKVIYKLTKD